MHSFSKTFLLVTHSEGAGLTHQIIQDQSLPDVKIAGVFVAGYMVLIPLRPSDPE